MSWCLHYVCIAVTKPYDKLNLGREEFVSAYSSIAQSITEGSQAGTQAREESGADADIEAVKE